MFFVLKVCDYYSIYFYDISTGEASCHYENYRTWSYERACKLCCSLNTEYLRDVYNFPYNTEVTDL